MNNKNLNQDKLANLVIAVLAILVLGFFMVKMLGKDAKMDAYAEKHNCTWTTYASHNICK